MRCIVSILFGLLAIFVVGCGKDSQQPAAKPAIYDYPQTASIDFLMFTRSNYHDTVEAARSEAEGYQGEWEVVDTDIITILRDSNEIQPGSRQIKNAKCIVVRRATKSGESRLLLNSEDNGEDVWTCYPGQKVQLFCGSGVFYIAEYFLLVEPVR